MEIQVCEHPEFIYGAVPAVASEAMKRTGIADYSDSRNSAGVRVRFSTNSKEVSVSYKGREAYTPQHIGTLLFHGFTYSVLRKKRYIKGEGFVNRTNADKFLIYKNESSEWTEYEFFAPSFVGIDNFCIYLDDDAQIEQKGHSYTKPILFLGGANCLGTGCTFANTTYPNIVSRCMDSDYFNFGENNSCYLKTELLAAISKHVSPWVIVAEVCSNTMELEYLVKKLPQYLDALSELFPDCPQVLMTHPYLGKDIFNYCKKIEKVGG